MKVTARPYFSVLISDSGRADSKRASGLENNRRREKARSINNGEKSIFVVRVRRRRRRSRGEIRQSIYRSAIHSSHVHAGETRNSIGTPCSAQVCVRTRQPFLPPAEFPLSPPVSSCRPKTVAEVREKIRDGERERERGRRGWRGEIKIGSRATGRERGDVSRSRMLNTARFLQHRDSARFPFNVPRDELEGS